MPITTATEPCWELVDHNGHPVEAGGDMIPHFATAQAAGDAKTRDVMAGDEPSESRWFTARPAQCDQPCAHVTCDGCDYALDEDEESTHFVDEDSAREIAKDHGWIFTPDGRLFCSPECHADTPATRCTCDNPYRCPTCAPVVSA